MRKSAIGFTFLLLWACSLFAQDSISHSHYNWKLTHSILEKIGRACVNTQQIPIPNIEILKSEATTITAKTLSGGILINEKVLDICRAMQKDSLNALAFILAHELTHYYKKDNAGFACIFHPNEQNQAFDISREKNADVNGHLYARLAGFSPCDVGENLISEIYRQFSLDDSNPNYPPEESRKYLITSACKAADTLVYIYESANFSTVLGELSIASDLYDYLLSLFPSRELYYNSALVRLTHLRENLIPRYEWKYDFPLILDFGHRFREDNLVINHEVIQSELESVSGLLEEAIKKDPDFWIAQYYLIYTEHLKIITGNEKTIKHQDLLSKLNTIPVSDSTLASIDLRKLLEGILLTFIEEPEKAKEVWKKVSLSPYFEFAQNNIAVLENTDTEVTPCNDYFIKKKIIPSYNPPSFSDSTSIYLPRLTLNFLKTQDSLYCHIQGDRFLTFKKIVCNKKMPLPNSPEGLIKLIGRTPCHTVFLANNKKVFHYQENNILFIYDSKNKLETCVIYEIREK